MSVASSNAHASTCPPPSLAHACVDPDHPHGPPCRHRHQKAHTSGSERSADHIACAFSINWGPHPMLSASMAAPPGRNPFPHRRAASNLCEGQVGVQWSACFAGLANAIRRHSLLSVPQYVPFTSVGRGGDVGSRGDASTREPGGQASVRDQSRRAALRLEVDTNKPLRLLKQMSSKAHPTPPTAEYLDAAFSASHHRS